MNQPNEVKTFHTSYSGGQAESLPTTKFHAGHKEVVALYSEYTAPGALVANWEFRKRVIQLAVRLFSGRTNWFINVDSDLTVQEYNYEFILDTVRFIATGHRRISIATWPTLITHNQSESIQKEHSEVRKLFRDLALNSDTVSMIQQWCKQPRGIDDLMFTLNILFGDREIQVTR